MEPESYQHMALLESRHWWFVARRKIVENVIRSFSLPRDPRILEAGSGTGGNMKMLDQFGTVIGLEPSRFARSIAEQQGPWEFVSGSLPDEVPFDDNSFDLITVLDVLEHLENDVESLAELVRTLKPGGIVLATVPAFPFLWSAHDEAHHHYRRYRRREIVSVLEHSGLRATYATYFNSVLFLPAAAIRVKKRLLKQGTHDMQSLPSTSINRVLTWAFGLERYAVPKFRLPVGLSLMTVGHKPIE